MQVFCLADSNKRQHCGDINFFSETLWAQKVGALKEIARKND